MSEYDKTIRLGPHRVRITFDGAVGRVFHDDVQMAERRGEGLLEFKVAEDDGTATYDVMLLVAGYIRVNVGRNGRLIFSDSQSFPVGEEGTT